jgi:hypothetical protein
MSRVRLCLLAVLLSLGLGACDTSHVAGPREAAPQFPTMGTG